MIKRLYDSFQPDNYKLLIDIDSENSKFSGKVEVTGKLIDEHPTIQLHSKGLQITTATVDGVTISYDKVDKFDTLTLTSGTKLKAGTHTVTVEFQGEITDAMHGIYPCYFEHEGKRKKLIATQFESHHAREVFPCIDEPAAKATFDLTLVSKEGEAVIANTPIKNQLTKNQRHTTEFETTPRMSTYLVAFVTGEMHYKEATTKDGVAVRSWTTVAQDLSWSDFSIQEAVSYLEFFNDYFGVSYPLKKCDQVALPDFESAAMENWGLITYREVVLLTDPKNPSLSGKQLISEVIAHELSHQWFGNLVTMKWWDDLWLNESFANMIACLAMDAKHPDWSIWEDYISQDGVAASNRDVYTDVQAVRVAVNDPSEIATLFDPYIVYAKGGKLLKVLLDTLGEDVWRAGLKDYFTKFAYKNTTKDDLWDSFTAHSDVNIAGLINPWLESSGQPLVLVSQSNSTVELSQTRFALDSNTDETLWPVPLLATGAPQIFTDQSSMFTYTESDWIKLNSSGFGHYVTNYMSTDHKKWINQQLSDPSQTNSWKITRLNELVMLAKHGDTGLDEALDAIEFSGKETRAAVWALIAGIVGNSRMLSEGDEDAEASIRLLTSNLAQTNFKQLGWDYNLNESSNQTHLRTTMISMMLASEDKTAIEHALGLYRSTKHTEQLPAELRSLIMNTVVKFGTSEEFEDLIKKHKQAKSSEFQADITSALTAAKKPGQIKKLLLLMTDSNAVRPQDLRSWFVYLMRNRYSRSLTWQWLEDNWTWIMRNFGSSKSYDDFARYGASFLNTHEMLNKYIVFFEDKKNDIALKRTVAIGIEEVRARVAWRDRDEPKVTAWLKKYSAKNS